MVKNIELIFAALYFYLYEVKSMFQIFKILFQTGDINIFVLCGVFFCRHVPLKSETYLVEKLSKINVAKY